DLPAVARGASLAMTGSWTIPPRKRPDKPFSLRAWVLAAAVFAALAAPGVGRAAGPSTGLGGLGDTINSALAQVQAVAPQAVAAAQPAVQQALAAVSTANELAAGPTAAAAPDAAPATTPVLSALASAPVIPGAAAAGEPVPGVAP